MRGFRLAVVGLAALAAAAARADSWLIGSNGAGTLYGVDPATGQTALYATTNVTGLAGITWDGRRTLYGLTTFGPNPGANSLFRIDLATGVATAVGPTGLSNIFEGDLDFDPISGFLYGLVDMPAVGVTRMFRMDPASGAATIVAAIPFTIDPSAMAFASDGTLYVLDTAGSRADLITLDLATGAVTSRATLAAIRQSVAAGMDFRPEDGLLYVGTNRSTGMLYRVDPATAVATEIGRGSIPNGYWGLSFAPEPGTAVLLAGGLAVLARRRRAIGRSRG